MGKPLSGNPYDDPGAEYEDRRGYRHVPDVHFDKVLGTQQAREKVWNQKFTVIGYGQEE